MIKEIVIDYNKRFAYMGMTFFFNKSLDILKIDA